MAARKAIKRIALTEEAKSDLERFTRQLSVRVNAKVDYSRALMYAIAAAESAQDWVEEMKRQAEPIRGVSPVEHARRLAEGGKS